MSSFDDYFPFIGGTLSAAMAIPLGIEASEYHWIAGVLSVFMGAVFLIAGTVMTDENLNRASKEAEN